MSAERLREAAALMRLRAEAATSGPWEFRPRRGFQSMQDNPATIGFKDAAGYFVMVREGTWGTEGDMGYIASWHPAVALAVADWLEAKAEQDEKGHCNADQGVCNLCEHDYGNVAALAVADAYLGATS